MTDPKKKLCGALCLGLMLAAPLSAGAEESTKPFANTLLQVPTLPRPEAASIAGSLAKMAFGPTEVSRGMFSLAGPFTAPAERGPLLADVFPSYSSENGLSEWGMGWKANLSISRFRVTGDIDYETDEFVSPWGRLRQGADGFYYPLGLEPAVRLTRAESGWTAVMPDGKRFVFLARDALETAAGTFQWMLSEVTTPEGDRQQLGYERNSSGRPFLKTVHYGGRGGEPTTAIELEYERLPWTFKDYRSGEAITLDRRVSAVFVKAREEASGPFVLRWTYDLLYEETDYGPAFYLTEVARTFASGETEPAVTYAYQNSTEHLSRARFVELPALDDYLRRLGQNALSPAHAMFFDFDADGLLDVEHSERQTLLRHGADGFEWEELEPRERPDDLCRRRPSFYNKPRRLVWLSPEADEPEVLGQYVDVYYGGVETELHICDRSGLARQVERLEGAWDLYDPNTLLVDLNRDQRPNLIHVLPVGYKVMVNETEGGVYRFRALPFQDFGSPFLPEASWVHDFNGDGVADLITRHSGGLSVRYGLGGFRFTTEYDYFGIISVSGYHVTIEPSDGIQFVDANHDGLADMVHTRGAGAWLFLNVGAELRQIDLPGFDRVDYRGYSIAVDLAGSGEMEILHVKTDWGYGGRSRATSIALSQPAAGLLVQADDGKGTILSFSYERSGPEPGIHQRPVVLRKLTVEASGSDPISYEYSYGEPVVHSMGKFVVGFGATQRASALRTEEARFHHDDDLSGIELSTTTRDAATPFVSFSERAYEPRDFAGVPFWRLAGSWSGFQLPDGAGRVGTQTDYEAYDRELCPTLVRTTTSHGVLERQTVLAEVPALEGALHCLSASEQLSGEHADPALDFAYAVELARNDLGQVTSVTALGDDGPLLLQEVTYNEEHRIYTVSHPGQGTTTSLYRPVTGILEELIAPEGVTTTIAELDPVTDAIRELRVNRGGGVWNGFYRYDGLERLWRLWDDAGSASETLPLTEYGYRYATTETPGQVSSRALRDPSGIAREEAKLLTAGGEDLAAATRIPQGWTVGALTHRTPAEGLTRAFYRPPLASADIAGLTHAELGASAVLLAEERRSGLDYLRSTWQAVQEGVERGTRGERVLEGGLVVHRETENESLSTRVATDAEGKVFWREDQLGGRTSFAYDALGRLVGVTLPDGQTHQARFDSYGRPARIDRQGVASVFYHYAPETGLRESTDYASPEGHVVRSVELERDAIGRVTQETHRLAGTGEARTFRFAYDGRGFTGAESEAVPGQLGFLSAVGGEGFERRLIRDSREQVTSERLTFPGWRAVERQTEYFEDGEPRREVLIVQDSAGRELERIEKENLLDEWGRLAGVKLGGVELFTLAYDAEGKLERANFADGQSIVFHYDPQTRKASGYLADGLDWTAGVDWQLNSRGLIGQEALTFDEELRQRSYEYEERGFLDSAADELSTAAYTYSQTGIPDWIADEKGERSFAREGREVRVGDVSYVYDELGRVIRRGDLELSYGPTGQLEAAERAGKRWEFIYDEAGNRLAKLEGGRPVAAYVFGGYLTEGGFALPLELAGRVVGLVRGGELELVATDPRGTLLAEGGEPNVATPYGARQRQPELSAILDYVAKGYDADLGTVRMGVRDYDPYVSQFWTPDPLVLDKLEACVERPLDCNLYSYAGNNPVSHVDPEGTWFESALDPFFIGYDIGSAIGHAIKGDWNAVKTDGIALAADVGCLLIPVATGGGAAVRAARSGVAREAAERGITYMYAGSRRATQAQVKAEQIQAAREVNGNSRLSTRAQHGYEIVDTTIGEVVKTGVSGGRRTAGGGTARANSQANRWNREAGQPGRYEPRVVQNVPAGPGARQRILEWEAENAARLREAGQLRDPTKHVRP